MNRKPVRTPRERAPRHRVAGATLALLVAAVLPAAVLAAPGDKDTGGAVAAPATSDAYWYDGKERRPLYASPDQAADFGGPSRKGADVLVPRGSVSTKSASDGVSPVFHDDGPGGSVRALPGGVIVTLKAAASEAAAR